MRAILVTLPGDFASEALAINNAGEVVGYSKGPNGMRAFLWTKSNGMEELGILAGGSSSRALAINDSGTVVGASDYPVGRSCVCLEAANRHAGLE